MDSIFGRPGLGMAKTIMSPGQTGDQTINSPMGSVRFESGSSSLTVTNSLVTEDSIIILTQAANDGNCNSINYTPGNGSFTINAPNAPIDEMRVDFVVLN